MAGIAITGVVALLASEALARSVACDHWTGATSQRWNVSSNWSAGVPTGTTAVCISAAAGHGSVMLDGKGVAATVSITHGADFAIGSTGRLRVVHRLRDGGTITFAASTAELRTPLATVTPHGTLSGIGAVDGNLDNAGTVLAVDRGTGVPLRISGRYQQRSSGVLLSRDEAGRFVQLHARSASLGGGLELLILDALVPGSKYAIVSAKTLSGRFDQIVPGYVSHYRHGVARVVVTPQITLGRSRVPQGKRVMVSGASFGYEGVVRFRLDHRTGPLLGSGNVTSVGGFEGFARIPPNTPPGPHVLVAVKPPLGYVARARFTVRAG